jgi:hypothetical protein
MQCIHTTMNLGHYIVTLVDQYPVRPCVVNWVITPFGGSWSFSQIQERDEVQSACDGKYAGGRSAAFRFRTSSCQ